MLDVAGPDGKGKVELFERGYGKDAAGIAKEAITYGMQFLFIRGGKDLHSHASQRQ